MVSAQAVFYGFGLIDGLIPERAAVKRLSSVIRAFVVLVGAAACAPAVFFLPAGKLWKETRVERARTSEASLLR
jgi:hypothetical protein